MAEIFNIKTGKYESYELPVKASLYEHDLDAVIECACCKKDVVYGDCFTSMKIHNERGLGYMVCSECCEKECDERRGWTKKRGAESDKELR